MATYLLECRYSSCSKPCLPFHIPRGLSMPSGRPTPSPSTLDSGNQPPGEKEGLSLSFPGPRHLLPPSCLCLSLGTQTLCSLVLSFLLSARRAFSKVRSRERPVPRTSGECVVQGWPFFMSDANDIFIFLYYKSTIYILWGFYYN